MLGRILLGDEEEQSTSYTDASRQPSLLDRARTAAGLQPTRREEAIETLCPSLTFRQRVYGFGICFGIGCLISLASMTHFHMLLAGKPAPFAVTYTIGNIVELSARARKHNLAPLPFRGHHSRRGVCALAGSTMFLVGPKWQLKRMTSPTRWLCALVYVGAMAATLVSALLLPGLTHWPSNVIAIIVVACIVVQFLAMFWYALSYIPYGRRMFRACCVSAIEGA